MGDNNLDYKERLDRAKKRREGKDPMRPVMIGGGAVAAVLALVAGVRLMQGGSIALPEKQPETVVETAAEETVETEPETLSEEQIRESMEAAVWEEKEAVINSYENLGIVQVSGFLNMREEPDKNAKINGKLLGGSAVSIIDDSVDGWYQVSSGGFTSIYLEEQCVPPLGESLSDFDVCAKVAEKLNVIAHSKGGLEVRYLISTLGAGDNIASLTTISTPHNGSSAMDKLMKLNYAMKLIGAGTDVFKRIGGDKKPDTFRCFEQLTTGHMKRFNEENPDAPGVLYRSCAFLMSSPLSDIIMSVPYIGVLLLNGRSDGFLTPPEVTHGEMRGVFTGAKLRGMSHCDEVDMRRMRCSVRNTVNGEFFADVPEMYVKLVSELKVLGL